MRPMLAYRHAFHAGNAADVLKHAVLVSVLQHMNQKDKPWRLVDTHAGAGAYALQSPQAQKHAEFADGIGRLINRPDLPPLLADYVAQVRAFNTAAGGKDTLVAYPGSPCIAHALMRPGDNLRLYELHPTDHGLLQREFAGDKAVQVHKGDGYAGLKAQLPPPSRRGVLLMDPPYEIKTDYAAVVAACRDALTRFAECVLLVWYPELTLRESAQLPQRLKAVAQTQARKGWLNARLTLAEPDARGFGMLGSGMFVFNPPHTLKPALQAALPVMAKAMGQFAGAKHRLEAAQGV